MRNELEAAKSTALEEVFSGSVTTDFNFERRFEQPLYAELVRDPEIQAALRRWRAELEAMRDDVARYLGSLSTGE